MAGLTQTAIRRELSAAVSACASGLFETANAASFGIAFSDFESWLVAIGQKYLPADCSQKDAEDLLGSLRVADLTLARACAAGQERAWEQFMARFRELLYDIALKISRESSQAKDLADSIYAELYGLNEREGERVSKLSYYMGRGSLEGWLRTVISQEFVNRYRSTKRLVSLDEEEEEGSQFAAPERVEVVPADSRVEAAVTQGLGTLDSESRFILSAYYLDGRKLAEIGRMLGFHEATASRKLERITKALRKAVLEGLIQRGMTERQAQEALEADVRDFQVNVRQALVQEKDVSTFIRKKK